MAKASRTKGNEGERDTLTPSVVVARRDVGESFAAIARDQGVSREYVRQLYRKARPHAPRRRAAARAKGLDGERDVAGRWTLAGFEVRGLESAGDHLCIRADGLTIHSETKRAERWKVPEWWEQTKRDAPQGTVPTLAMRRNRGEWLVLLRLDDLTALLAAKS